MSETESAGVRIQHGVIVMFCDGTYAKLSRLSGFANARTKVDSTPNVHDADLFHEHDFRQTTIAQQLREIGVAAVLPAKAVIERKVTLEKIAHNDIAFSFTNAGIAEKIGIRPAEDAP